MKIIFLIKCKAPAIIYWVYFLTKIRNIFLKKKIKYEKRKHINYLKDKNISVDYFSQNSFNFLKVLSKLNENFNYLEIGSFEGNSAMFVANRFPNAKISCVDNWQKTEEYDHEIDFLKVENNFDKNISQFTNIQKNKKDSDSFFNSNTNYFQVIYIDCYHYGPQVYKDVKNSWKFLMLGGYLICDDYIWSISKKLDLSPCFAINKFLRENKDCYKIILISNNQIFLKKIK